MTANGGKGSALHVDPLRVRFAKQLHGGPRQGSSVLNDRIMELRKLLRTDKSIPEIAEILNVNAQTVRGFIKRRRLCDIAARNKFITLQRSLRKLEEAAS